jgi:DNA-binding transcriptional MerR regulator
MPEKDEQGVYSIGAVARMLDLPASTLRAWEERYEVIVPIRSGGAQRLYSRSQVEQLRFLKSHIEAGVSAADAHRLLAQELATGRLLAASGADRATGPLVLIAERDAYAAGLAEYFLRTEGYEVATALDATQAELFFAELRPNVVLMDMMISGGAGFRLLADFASSPNSQVLAVSPLDSADEALRAGASAFMRKPLDPLKLVSTVRDLLGTSALVRPSARRPTTA